MGLMALYRLGMQDGQPGRGTKCTSSGCNERFYNLNNTCRKCGIQWVAPRNHVCSVRLAARLPPGSKRGNGRRSSSPTMTSNLRIRLRMRMTFTNPTTKPRQISRSSLISLKPLTEVP